MMNSNSLSISQHLLSIFVVVVVQMNFHLIDYSLNLSTNINKNKQINIQHAKATKHSVTNKQSRDLSSVFALIYLVCTCFQISIT